MRFKRDTTSFRDPKCSSFIRGVQSNVGNIGRNRHDTCLRFDNAPHELSSIHHKIIARHQRHVSLRTWSHTPRREFLEVYQPLSLSLSISISIDRY